MIYQYLIKPKSNDEDISRREFILNIILLGSISLFLILNLLIIYNTIRLEENYGGISSYIFLLLFIGFIILLFLSRTGKHIVAALLLIGIYFFATTYAIQKWGPDLPTALLGYALIITISCILINTYFAFIVTCIISFLVISLTFLHARLLFLPHLDWKAEKLGTYDGIGFAAILFIIMLVSWLSNREIERSLKRARRSETALREERDSLEIKVGERTDQLRKLQMQRVAELHHLAESGKLASGLFHDLMNPLTALTLSVETLGNKTTNNADQLSRQVKKALHASRRVGQFLTALQRQTATAAAPERLHLQQELQNITKLLDYKARKQQIKLKLKNNTKAELLMSPTDFNRIFHNLIDFAIENAQPIPNMEARIVAVEATKDKEKITVQIRYPATLVPELNSDQNQTLGFTIAQNTLQQIGGSLSVATAEAGQIITLTAFLPY